MIRVLTLAALALVLAPLGAAAEGSATGNAKVRLVSMKPLKVKGTGFLSREQITVRVTGRGTSIRKKVTATRTGGWVLAFAVPFERCNGLIVRATGSRGSRAGMKLPQPLCPPPL
jgi:hypothetical protein